MRTPCLMCSDCDGFTSPRARLILCASEEHSGHLSRRQGGYFWHRLAGPCACGIEHGIVLSGTAVEDPRAVEYFSAIELSALESRHQGLEALAVNRPGLSGRAWRKELRDFNNAHLYEDVPGSPWSVEASARRQEFHRQRHSLSESGPLFFPPATEEEARDETRRRWEAMQPYVGPLVVERDGATCRVCGSTEGPFAIDHIVPIARGGKNTLSNLQVLCRSCNARKGAR